MYREEESVLCGSIFANKAKTSHQEIITVISLLFREEKNIIFKLIQCIVYYMCNFFFFTSQFL